MATARDRTRSLPDPAALFCAAALLLAGCGSVPTSTREAVGPQPARQRVEYYASGRSGPAVVLENGMAATLDDWKAVLDAIEPGQRVFAYNRPGYGRSTPVDGRRDGARVVEELRARLREQGLTPPYVLVGHSLGGLYMQLFARTYPQETAALVLVESTHPEQFKGAGAFDRWPAGYRFLFDLGVSAAARREFDAIDLTGEQVLARPTLTDTPVIVLSATEPLRESSAFHDDANAKRKAIAALYPTARQVWVDGGHQLPRDNPAAVVRAIREALAAHAAKTPAPAVVPEPPAASLLTPGR